MLRETTNITRQTVSTLSSAELALVRFLYSSQHVVAEELCIESIPSEVSFNCWEALMAISRSCRWFTSVSSIKFRSTSCGTLCSAVTRSSSFRLFFSFFSNTLTLLSSSSCIVSLLASTLRRLVDESSTFLFTPLEGEMEDILSTCARKGSTKTLQT